MERAGEEFEAWLRDKAEEIADRHFYATVSGVGWPNDDGSDRQKLIAACEPEEFLTLEPEPTNPFHKQAIKVLTGAGKQLGYLDRRCAQELTNKMAAGAGFTAAVCERREAGHRDGQHIHGLVIVIFELNAAARAAAKRGAPATF